MAYHAAVVAATTDVDDNTYGLPAALNGIYSWVEQGSIFTKGPVQYVVWVDDNRHGRISRRTHLQPWETSVDLFNVAGTAQDRQFVQDSHNYIVVGVDDRGYVHVSGDHHSANTTPGSEPLRYMRTNSPHDIRGTWTSGGMIGTEEGNVTYPQFIRAKDNTLYFFYRDGMSGNGDWFLNKFNSATLTWSRIGKIIDGKTNTASAYPHPMAIDRTTGRWHMFWTWRDGTGGAEFNTDICYAYSDDDGTTWRNTAGTAYTLPITMATGEVIVDHAGGLTEMIINGGTSEVDSSGVAHSTWIINDSGGVGRYRHIYHNGTSWQYENLWPTLQASRRPTTVCFPDGRVWMLYSTGAGGLGNRLRAKVISGAGTDVLLYDVDMLAYEPTCEWSFERKTLYALCPVERQNGLVGGEPADIGAQLNVPVLAVT